MFQIIHVTFDKNNKYRSTIKGKYYKDAMLAFEVLDYLGFRYLTNQFYKSTGIVTYRSYVIPIKSCEPFIMRAEYDFFHNRMDLIHEWPWEVKDEWMKKNRYGHLLP